MIRNKFNFLYDLKEQLIDLYDINMYEGEDGDLMGIVNDIDYTLKTTIDRFNDIEKNLKDELMCIRKQMQDIENNLPHDSEHTMEFIKTRRFLDINLI